MPSWIDVNRLPTDERSALENILDAQRIGLIRKVEDLSDDAARKTPSASTLSLLALIKHATIWEQRWFEYLVAGRKLPDGWPEVEPAEPDADFALADADTVESCIADYRAQIEKSKAITATTPLDARGTRPDLADCNLRYVMLHLIQETARHAGHADIIRESLDGTTGI
ncbi:DinB family protein [Kribbella sp. NPDC051770]|uniref:DinB family protein n=1 Tax=Kribbella sp. NPDC051770 TaxID=3155413 RepID=UPI00342F3643